MSSCFLHVSALMQAQRRELIGVCDQRLMLSAGIPSGQKESCVLRTFLAAFAVLTFDPCQPSLVKEHNLPNMDLNKQCNP